MQPILRAYIVLSPGKPEAKRSPLTTLKTLATFLAEYCQHNHLPIAWCHLTEPLLEQAEQYYQANKSQSYAYSAGSCLSQFASFLTLNHLCRRLDYFPSTPNPQKANVATLAGQQRGQAKLPSNAALYGLAKLYNNTALTEDDQFILSALVILFASGIRIGELVSLPLDCIDEQRGYCYLRYYNQKTDDAYEQEDLPLGKSNGDRAELVKEAVAKIKALTAAPRARAKILEANLGRCPIPGYGLENLIRSDEICKLLGNISPGSLLNLIHKGKLSAQKIGRYNYCTGATVENHLQTLLPTQLWTKRLKDNTYQPLSQSLFVIFDKFLNPSDVTNPLICTTLTNKQIYHYISPRESGKGTLFERHEIREDNNEICRVYPHQFRHYMDSRLRKGGMSHELITLYRNRSSVQQTQQYDHWDEEDNDTVRDKIITGIREGTLVGTAQRTYDILPAGERLRYAEGIVGMTHSNIYGHCIHNFDVRPCPHHGNCVKGCTDFLFEPGNLQQYQAILTRRASTQHGRDRMVEQAKRKHIPYLEEWLADCDRTLAGCNRTIAAHESAIAKRSLVSPNDITVTTHKEN